ncbi:MAG: cytidine deaminase [Eubacteriales bacterium]|nr:cytidine deaminase [Eubacteriales bacterium]
MTDRELLELAKEARQRAYTPYSHFRVGAALLTKEGKVYQGCNIENAAYGPTNCAERTAFFTAVYEGERQFEAIAIAGGPEQETGDDTCAPCGICRQVMMEFCDPQQFRVILADREQGCRSYRLAELLPLGFGPKDLA